MATTNGTIPYDQLSDAAVVALASTGACTITDTQPPPLGGPSEMALSLAITANPDVLSLDGASQSQIRIVARDENGQPKANVLLRVEIVVDGRRRRSASSRKDSVTDSNGRATFTYTAPPMVGARFPDPSSSSHRAGTTTPPRICGVGHHSSGSAWCHRRSAPADFSFTPTSPRHFPTCGLMRPRRQAVSGRITGSCWDFGDNT